MLIKQFLFLIFLLFKCYSSNYLNNRELNPERNISFKDKHIKKFLYVSSIAIPSLSTFLLLHSNKNISIKYNCLYSLLAGASGGGGYADFFMDQKK